MYIYFWDEYINDDGQRKTKKKRKEEKKKEKNKFHMQNDIYNIQQLKCDSGQ